MKKLLISFIILFSWSAQAQTYTYKPLNLDTSSFWVQTYRFYRGFPYVSVQGQVLQYVEKDTLINNHNYHKIIGYCTRPSYQSGQFNPQAEWEYYKQRCYNPTIFIREDTVQKKIFSVKTFSPFYEYVLLDYNLIIGDTVNYVMTDTNLNSPTKLNIDTIYVASFFGIDRKLYQNDSMPAPGGDAYKIIEGVGATHNFPDIDWGISEWLSPQFTLEYYNQYGTVQYNPGNYPIDSCYKRARAIGVCWPITTSDIDIKGMDFKINNNSIILNNIQTTIELSVFSSLGQVVFTDKTTNQYYQRNLDNLPAGVYIIQLQSKNESITRKILIN